MPYFHVVFTLPHALNGLVRLNEERLYGLLFEAAAATLQDFARNPRWLGGELGFTLVLHTWSQTLVQHPHVPDSSSNTWFTTLSREKVSLLRCEPAVVTVAHTLVISVD